MAYEHSKPGPEPGHAYGAAAITQAIRGADFPMSKQDLINMYGDKEVEYTKGNPQRLRDILEKLPGETYNSPADLEHAVHEMMM
ncbi:MAG: hypothetical protein A2287_07205 [Candidatus Melainabacteria bacterium RIFOXYA12_FULL_32_12]|nr:MAG: hypothetical protein A2255_11090 [Candidatus Melainabacteria bacterium RIFOXYA2_FULL_32_9]OGI28196.1 MAG: hypothetical protein A2287_07205 [Candidatus Melainabacteria bacterium RIFOXYA12_FULL_32_12]